LNCADSFVSQAVSVAHTIARHPTCILNLTRGYSGTAVTYGPVVPSCKCAFSN
jgi:hypothetical protein